MTSIISGHRNVSFTLMSTAGTFEISLNPRNMNSTAVKGNFGHTTSQKEMPPFLTRWQEHTFQRLSP